MSDDIKKLVERLDEHWGRRRLGDMSSLYADAADALEALVAERDQLLIDLEEYRRDVEALVKERDRMRSALGGVMEWIDNWSPPFTQDREWAKTELKARKALEAKE